MELDYLKISIFCTMSAITLTVENNFFMSHSEARDFSNGNIQSIKAMN